MPLAMRAYIGGHKFEFTPTSSNSMGITKDGVAQNVPDMGSQTFMEGKEEIAKLVQFFSVKSYMTIFLTHFFSRIIKWGSVYTLHSEGNVMVNFDGTFVQIIPAPYIKGQHCGVCGNFDGNKNNEFLNKAGAPVVPRLL